jgi:hypothetical protein
LKSFDDETIVTLLKKQWFGSSDEAYIDFSKKSQLVEWWMNILI